MSAGQTTLGKVLLSRQLGWVVGSGTEINIWTEPWLSSSEQLRPIGPPPCEFQALTVADLIREDTAEWDEQKIDIIIPFHKAQILQIKPSVCKAKDELVWLKTSTGEYTAKSGYRAQSELLLLEEAENPISSRCTRCSDLETVAHLLFTCPYARKVWKLAPLATTIDVDQITDTLAGMELIRRVPSLPPVGLGPGTLTAALCWNLWISRNQLTFQKRDFSPEETLLKATTDAREWLLAQISLTNPNLKPPSINQDPIPDTDIPCMYTDAAWNASTGRAGLGWIIDDTGSSSTHSATASFVKSPLFAETLAMRSAMNSAIDKGITSLLILSDSQVLIKLVNSKGKKLEIADSQVPLMISTFYLIALMLSCLNLSQEQTMIEQTLLPNRL